MLSPPKFQALLEILDQKQLSFEDISRKKETIFTQEEYSSLSTTLKLLIKDKYLKDTQKIIAIYLVYTIENDDLTIGLSNLEFKLENFIKQLSKLDNNSDLSFGIVKKNSVSPLIILSENFKPNNVILERFEAPFAIEVPDLIEIDPIWLFPPLNHDLIFEPDLNIPKELSDLFIKAFKYQLQPSQVDKVCNEIDIQTAIKLGLDPSSFVKLIQINPKIAGTLIMKMVSSSYLFRNQYIDVLLNTPISIETNEAVLLIIPLLTPENLYYYISKSIELCEKDKSQRLIRILCIFIQFLIKNNSINLTDDMAQLIKGFCLQFSNIKESSMLFQLIEKK